MEAYKYTNSRLLFERAMKVIPAGVYGHLGPVEGSMIPPSAFPFFSREAKGAYFWDVDGNRFIDYMCAYGPNILGYNDEDVDRAAREQRELGDCVTLPSVKMVEFAELLVDTVHSADWAFFAKNGGDATSFAVMVARAATGRKKAVLVNKGYHGVAPWTKLAGNPGIAPEEIANNLYVDWNNIGQLEALISAYPGQIACFIASPYFQGNFVDNVLPDQDYWQKVRSLCTKHGIVLIIDDVRCGFRLDLSGSDHHYGFEADLICFCKALANGYNVSALCGIDALKSAASSVFYTGSYWFSAVPFAAGIATLHKLKELEAPKRLQALGSKLTSGLTDVAAGHGLDLRISGELPMWYMRIANDPSQVLHQEWIAACVQRGVFFTNHHNHFINAALTEEDIAFTLDVADEAFRAVKKMHPSFV
ncbi:aminotransferase class III-fold pyridoxal phosphate-dependent enzyme [Paenibacillus sp. HW567]|uniref:aminotransferase class III-fold pyridoxal phosphate-dependent enzyme n=1 Tax=Paenibacillus sp. HW567 TaxID=1034769 RepID=UPI00036476C0|nr:aminotransferase class III-fold pyridoxal phosphate-dependent enzyme [Paenibacillus sp. HW567]